MLEFIISPITDNQLFHFHNIITNYMIIVWFVFAVIGFLIKSRGLILKITYFLIGLSFVQEILDYINRIFINDLYVVELSEDLPFQLCHIAYWLTVICLIMSVSNKNYKYKNYFFSCAYIFGFGALQGIITVDITGLYTFGDILALHLQHSIIVLNIIWLIFCFGMKLEIKGIFQAFISVNILAIIIGFINYLLGSNYMFLCDPPKVNNILVTGDWPYYIIVFDLIVLIGGFLLYLPFRVIDSIKKY